MLLSLVVAISSVGDIYKHLFCQWLSSSDSKAFVTNVSLVFPWTECWFVWLSCHREHILPWLFIWFDCIGVSIKWDFLCLFKLKWSFLFGYQELACIKPPSHQHAILLPLAKFCFPQSHLKWLFCLQIVIFSMSPTCFVFGFRSSSLHAHIIMSFCSLYFLCHTVLFVIVDPVVCLCIHRGRVQRDDVRIHFFLPLLREWSSCQLLLALVWSPLALICLQQPKWPEPHQAKIIWSFSWTSSACVTICHMVHNGCQLDAVLDSDDDESGEADRDGEAALLALMWNPASEQQQAFMCSHRGDDIVDQLV